MYTRNCEIKEGVVFPSEMQRIALGIEYCGTTFSGFQKQKTSSNTIQAALEAAISRVANEQVSLVCAGRTDAKVHATGQVIHFDTLAKRSLRSWVDGTNTYLPADIAVKWCLPVTEHFHARFSATARRYRYVFYENAVRPAVMNEKVTWTRYQLNRRSMEEASQFLIGEHDFSSFRSAQCQAHSPVREVKSVVFFQSGPFWVMEIYANAFLHHMVRNIAGVMIDIGREAKPANWMRQVINLRDRTQSAPTASPNGLYLVDVDYPDTFNIPKAFIGPDFIS